MQNMKLTISHRANAIIIYKPNSVFDQVETKHKPVNDKHS